MDRSSRPDPELTALEAVMDRSSRPDPELTALEAVMGPEAVDPTQN